MYSVPFALSIHKYLNSLGADLGAASLIAVALLVLLYFAHARETATLRERLAEAHERIGALEARIAQLAQLQSMRPPQPFPAPTSMVTPPPASLSARPMGSAVASIRRTPSPGEVEFTAVTGLLPAASYGLGAPALASATKLIPDPGRAATPAALAADDTMMVPAAGSNGDDGGRFAAPVAAAALAAPAPAPAPAAGAPATAGAVGQRGGGVPPRVQIRPQEPIGPPPRRAAPPPRGYQPVQEQAPSHRLRRVLGAIAALILVAAIVFVLVKVTSSGTSTKSTVDHHSKTSKVAAFRPGDVTVAVLNGTSVAGLAQSVSDDLKSKGYVQGAITNAAVQTQTNSTVSYVQSSDKVAAEHVAKALKLKPSAVQRASQSAIESCASPSASGTSCQADVIVTLGTDLASMASTTSS